MNALAYFIIADLIIILFIVKALFNKPGFFLKALYIYFYPDEIGGIFPEWEKKNDSNHKVHLLYGCALALIGVNVLVYMVFLDSNFIAARLAG